MIMPWRSLLFLPAHNQSFVAKAHSKGADAYVLDLEDSVPAELKPNAREKIAAASLTVTKESAQALVRINAGLRLAVRDLESAVCASVKAIVIPKVTSAAQVKLLAEVINELEIERHMKLGHTGIIAQIESVNAMPYLDAIATSSPRMLGMTLGSEDFAESAGMEPITEALLLPNQQLLMACRRAGIMPLGFPASIADYSDMQDFKSTITLARKLGFVGAFCIHPTQVAVLNSQFTPSKHDILLAQRLIAASEIQRERGKAVFQFDGKMVDAPVVTRARNLLDRARQLVQGAI